jgi:hypothetical protein
MAQETRMRVNRRTVFRGLAGAASAATAITRRYVEFASQLRFEALPDSVVHATKRYLLDSLGCPPQVAHDWETGEHPARPGQGPAACEGALGARDPVRCAHARTDAPCMRTSERRA